MNAKEILKKYIFPLFFALNTNKSKSVIKMLNEIFFARLEESLHNLSAFFYNTS